MQIFLPLTYQVSNLDVLDQLWWERASEALVYLEVWQLCPFAILVRVLVVRHPQVDNLVLTSCLVISDLVLDARGVEVAVDQTDLLNLHQVLRQFEDQLPQDIALVVIVLLVLDDLLIKHAMARLIYLFIFSFDLM